MKQDQIARIWNDLRMATISTTMFDDLTEESQFKVRAFVQAIEVQMKDDFDKAALALRSSHEGASHALDIMMRTYGAVVAWRDKYKVRQRTEIQAFTIVELVNTTMAAVGWYPPETLPEHAAAPDGIKLIADATCTCSRPAGAFHEVDCAFRKTGQLA